MKRLYILYDARCGLCSWARHWMLKEPAFLELEFLAAGSPRAKEKFPSLVGVGTVEELVVVDDEGGVYRDSDAWIICLYALQDFRAWSFRLASPLLRPFARAAFHQLSTNRHVLSGLLHAPADEPLIERLRGAAPPACAVTPVAGAHR